MVAIFQKDEPAKGDPCTLMLKLDDKQLAGLNLTHLSHACSLNKRLLLSSNRLEVTAATSHPDTRWAASFPAGGIFASLLIELLAHLFGFWDAKCIGKSNGHGENIAGQCQMLTETFVFHSAGLLVNFLSDGQSNDSFLVFVAAVACVGVHANLLQELEREFFGVAARNRFLSAGFAFHVLGFRLSFFGKHSQLFHVNVHLFDIQPLCWLLWGQ